MSNFFKNLTVYAGKWSLKAEAKLDSDDKELFTSAKVVSSEYGKSICFFLKAGGQQYIPMSNQGRQVNIGDVVSLDDISIQVLEKQGEKDILRAKIQ